MAKWVVKTAAQYQRAIKELQENIERRIRSMYFESVQEFYDFCVQALKYSVENAPRDTGDLRGTAYLEINGSVCAIGADAALNSPQAVVGTVHARIVFPMHYALIQHEHWEFNHPNGGQAFYLEIGVAQAAKEFAQRLSAFRG